MSAAILIVVVTWYDPLHADRACRIL